MAETRPFRSTVTVTRQSEQLPMFAPDYSDCDPWLLEPSERFNAVNDESLGQESDRAAIRQPACQ